MTPIAPAAAVVFGEAETIPVGDLAVGDFLVEVHAQSGYRATVINAGVAEIVDTFDRWTRSTGYRRPRVNMRSRQVRLRMGTPGYNLPADWTVSVRRPRPS